jgi:hypothetical protein
MEQNHLCPKWMAQKWGRLFCEILGWVFFGDVLNNMFRHFRRDGAESSVADGWSKSGEGCFVKFLDGCFLGMF